MKKDALENKFKELREKYPNYKGNNTEMFNLQYDTNELFIKIINDFNEKTGQYNMRIGFLTAVMTITTVLSIIILCYK